MGSLQHLPTKLLATSVDETILIQFNYFQNFKFSSILEQEVYKIYN